MKEQLGGDGMEGACVDVDADQDDYIGDYFDGQDCNDDFFSLF